jgi:hypothetical protein
MPDLFYFLKIINKNQREILVFEEMSPLFHSLLIVWGGATLVFLGEKKFWTMFYKLSSMIEC